MENSDRTSNQGGQGQGNEPSQDGGQQGGQEGQGRSQDAAKRSNSKFVRNDGSATEGQDIRQEQGGSRDDDAYEYKGGRQATGGIPNPDDDDDNDSAGSFRGTAKTEPDEGDDDAKRGVRPGQIPSEDLNSQPRNPK
jgi:hypothetical protein